MKKLIKGLFVFIFLLTSLSFAENAFTTALKDCSNYSQQGSIPYEKTYFTVTITLNKSRNKCVYKEKVSQGTNYQLLTCNFDMNSLSDIAGNMDTFTTAYAKEVQKNRIFEAKLTTNAYVLENYLIDPKICQITSSASSKTK